MIDKRVKKLAFEENLASLRGIFFRTGGLRGWFSLAFLAVSTDVPFTERITRSDAGENEFLNESCAGCRKQNSAMISIASEALRVHDKRWHTM
jgi:hypothetical protein